MCDRGLEKEKWTTSNASWLSSWTSLLGSKLAHLCCSTRYKQWCVQQGEQSLVVQDFKAKLQEAHDITHTRTKGRSWWRGIKLRD